MSGSLEHSYTKKYTEYLGKHRRRRVKKLDTLTSLRSKVPPLNLHPRCKVLTPFYYIVLLRKLLGKLFLNSFKSL